MSSVGGAERQLCPNVILLKCVCMAGAILERSLFAALLNFLGEKKDGKLQIFCKGNGTGKWQKSVVIPNRYDDYVS